MHTHFLGINTVFYKETKADLYHSISPNLYISLSFACRLCGFEPFYDERGDQYMFKRILNCEYDFVSPWWDDVSLNAKDLVSSVNFYNF